MKLDLIETIRKASDNPDLTHLAAAMAGNAITAAFQATHDRKPGALRGSDAGGCVRAVYADVHDLLDIPDDYDSKLFKMNGGTMSGAWLAALLAVGLETDERYQVSLEHEIDEHDFTGHIDALIYRDEKPWCVVEMKATFVNGAPKAPDDPYKNGNVRTYQIIQAAKYAAYVGAPYIAVVTSSPGGMRCDWYDYAAWEDAAVEDTARLMDALGPTMPAGDPRETWRCNVCKFSKCESNKNALREIA